MPTSFEAYEIERADFERVLGGIRQIQSASFDNLSSVDWLADVIREVGLVSIPDAERTYGKDADFLNSSQQGLIQIPREYARFLVCLGQYRPASYLEIGCFNGASACLATAYLQRFNSALYAVSIDLFPAFVFHSEVRNLLPLRYEVGVTSFDFRDEHFDAVFIDGDHSFEWAWADYQNCGRSARLCAFHDVNNSPYFDLHMGGVPAVWELVKQQEKTAKIEEIFDHPKGEPYMGIGVRIRE